MDYLKVKTIYGYHCESIAKEYVSFYDRIRTELFCITTKCYKQELDYNECIKSNKGECYSLKKEYDKCIKIK